MRPASTRALETELIALGGWAHVRALQTRVLRNRYTKALDLDSTNVLNCICYLGYTGDRHRRGGERSHDYRTYLSTDGTYKAPGIETALSAARLFGVPSWPAISTNGIETLGRRRKSGGA